MMTSRTDRVDTMPLVIDEVRTGRLAGGLFGRTLSRVVLYTVLVLVSIIMVAPFYFLVSGSLMDRGEMFKIPPHLWPAKPIWENFKTIFTEYNFARYLRNSLIVSIAQTLGVLFFSSLAGFVFAKRHFPGRNWLFIFVLITAAMPSGQTTIIPFYLLMVKFHWIDTFWPLIIPWWAPPLSIFLMRQYIANGVPDELIDASRLEGTGLFGTYWRIVIPLSVPGLVVVGIMQFVAIWNDFLYSLLVLKSENMRTATLAIATLSQRTQQATLYGPLFAGIVVVTVPPILLYFIFQRRLTSGLLAGSIRG